LKRYRAELFLAVVLTLVCLAVGLWQAPGSRLNAAEVEAYLSRIDAGASTMPAGMKARLLQRMRAWGLADDGRPVHMLNLMRFHPQLQAWPGAAVDADSPEQANERYEDIATAIALPKGLSMAFAGASQATGDAQGASTSLFSDAGQIDNLDRVLVVRYPSRRAFFELISDPGYLKIMPYKFAAVDLTLMPMQAITRTPDPRLLVVAGALIILLAFGWWRALRRAT
jgi:hypothetical protein